MSIVENAVVKITIDDREARAQLAAFERAKQQALAGGAATSPSGQIGSQALGRSAALVGATAPATRSGALVSAGGVTLPAGAVAYHDITRAMQALPQGTPQAQVMALARQYAGGAPAQTAERAGEQIVQREVEGLRRGMARGAAQAATQAGGGVGQAAPATGGRPLFGGVLSGSVSLLSLGSLSLSAMAIATGAIGAAGAANDAYREWRGPTAGERAMDLRRLAAERAAGERFEPVRAAWESVTTGAMEFAATGQLPAAPAAPPGGWLDALTKTLTTGFAKAGDAIKDAITEPSTGGWQGMLASGGLSAAPAIAAAMLRQTAPAAGVDRTGPTAAQAFQTAQDRTTIALGRRDQADQAAAIARAQVDFGQDQERERNALVRNFFRQAADLSTAIGRAERDIGTQVGRAQRDIGVGQRDAYADLATSQGYGRQDIERGYQRSVRGAVLSEVLPGGLTGALIGAGINRQDALADLDLGGSRQAAAIGLRGERAMRDLGTQQGDLLADLGTRKGDAVADMQTAYKRAQDDLLENQRVAAERFTTNVGLMTDKLNDAVSALDLYEKQVNLTSDGMKTKYQELTKAQEDYQRSLRTGAERFEASARFLNQAMQQ